MVRGGRGRWEGDSEREREWYTITHSGCGQRGGTFRWTSSLVLNYKPVALTTVRWTTLTGCDHRKAHSPFFLEGKSMSYASNLMHTMMRTISKIAANMMAVERPAIVVTTRPFVKTACGVCWGREGICDQGLKDGTTHNVRSLGTRPLCRPHLLTQSIQ